MIGMKMPMLRHIESLKNLPIPLVEIGQFFDRSANRMMSGAPEDQPAILTQARSAFVSPSGTLHCSTGTNR